MEETILQWKTIDDIWNIRRFFDWRVKKEGETGLMQYSCQIKNRNIMNISINFFKENEKIFYCIEFINKNVNAFEIYMSSYRLNSSNEKDLISSGYHGLFDRETGTISPCSDKEISEICDHLFLVILVQCDLYLYDKN